MPMKKMNCSEPYQNRDNTTQLYEALLTCSDRMLQSARQQRWEELMHQEVEMVKYVELITREESEAEHSPDQTDRHREIMQEVMSRSEETQLLLFSRKDELDMLTMSRNICSPAVFSGDVESANDGSVVLH